MKKLVICFIALILFFPVSIKAASCSQEQVARYKKLANNIQTSLEYIENGNEVLFTITFHNVYQDLYLVDYYTFDKVTIYKGDGTGIIVASGYPAGSTYKFSISNNDSLCDTKIISNISVEVPFYNTYSNDPLCTGIETYSLCQKWINIKGKSYESFRKEVLKYKAQLNEQEQQPNVPVEDNTVNRIRNFIANYYLYFVLFIILIATLIIILVNKKKKTMW